MSIGNSNLRSLFGSNGAHSVNQGKSDVNSKPFLTLKDLSSNQYCEEPDSEAHTDNESQFGSDASSCSDRAEHARLFEKVDRRVFQSLGKKRSLAFSNDSLSNLSSFVRSKSVGDIPGFKRFKPGEFRENTENSRLLELQLSQIESALFKNNVSDVSSTDSSSNFLNEDFDIESKMNESSVGSIDSLSMRSLSFQMSSVQSILLNNPSIRSILQEFSFQSMNDSFVSFGFSYEQFLKAKRLENDLDLSSSQPYFLDVNKHKNFNLIRDYLVDLVIHRDHSVFFKQLDTCVDAQKPLFLHVYPGSLQGASTASYNSKKSTGIVIPYSDLKVLKENLLEYFLKIDSPPIDLPSTQSSFKSFIAIDRDSCVFPFPPVPPRSTNKALALLNEGVDHLGSSDSVLFQKPPTLDLENSSFQQISVEQACDVNTKSRVNQNGGSFVQKNNHDISRILELLLDNPKHNYENFKRFVDSMDDRQSEKLFLTDFILMYQPEFQKIRNQDASKEDAKQRVEEIVSFIQDVFAISYSKDLSVKKDVYAFVSKLFIVKSEFSGNEFDDQALHRLEVLFKMFEDSIKSMHDFKQDIYKKTLKFLELKPQMHEQLFKTIAIACD